MKKVAKKVHPALDKRTFVWYNWWDRCENSYLSCFGGSI